MDSNSTDSPGNPGTSGSRKRKREGLEERRLKGRYRKRRKRAALPPLARQANSPSSSSDSNIAEETVGNPAGRFYLYNAQALQRLEEKVVAAGRPIPHGFREFTSVQPAHCSSSDEHQSAPGVQQNEAEDDSQVHGNDTETPGNNSEEQQSDEGEPFEDHGTAEVGDEDDADNGVEINTDSSREQDHSSDTSEADSEEGRSTSSPGQDSDREGNAEDNAEAARNPYGNTEQEEAVIRRQWNNMTDVQKLAIDVAGVRGSSRATDSSIDKLFKVVFKHMDTIRKVRGNGGRKKTYSKFLRRVALKYAPVVTTDLLLEEKTPDGGVEYHRVEGLKAIPDEYRRQQSNGRFRIIREESSVNLPQIKAHHERVHVKQGMDLASIREQYKNCILSLDGVEESKSGQKKFHVASIKIGECIYPFKIYDYVIGHEAAKISTNTILGPIVQELNQDPDIVVTYVVADMPERHTLRGLTTISGRWSCEFCTGSGETGGGISWPYPKYWDCPLREHDTMEGIARLGIGLLRPDPEGRQGIVNFSPLFDLNTPFDIVWGLPVDQFHLIFEGIVKEMLKRMFINRGTIESRRFHRALSDMFRGTRVFSEIPRAARPLQLSSLKGNEYGVLALSVLIPFCVQILKDAPEDSHWCHRKRAILYMVFLTRLYNYEDNILDSVRQELQEEGSSLEDLHRRFYEEYQRGFCTKPEEKPFINVHTFRHLEEQRRRTGPLWRFSAEDFESLYSVMRRCYQVGTTNPSKQALENFYMRDMSHHRCRSRKSLVVAPSAPNKSKVADHLVMNRQGFRAVISADEHHVICHPVDVEELDTSFLGVHLPWRKVGVARYGEINYARRVKIARNKLTGKAMLSGKILTEWPKEWLGGSKRDY